MLDKMNFADRIIPIKVNITCGQIADLMTSAIEHNDMTRSWCAGVFLEGAWKKRMDELDDYWYADPQLYNSREFTIEIHEDDAITGKIIKHRRNADDLVNALAKMANKSPAHFSDILIENGDAITADVFLQYLALGEVKYG